MRKIIHRKSFVFCRQKMQQPQSQQKRVPVCRGCSSISRFTQMFSIYKFIFTSKQISSVLSCPRLAQRSNIHSALVFNFSLLLCLFLFSSDEESKYVRMRDSFCLALLVILFSPYLLELSVLHNENQITPIISISPRQGRTDSKIFPFSFDYEKSRAHTRVAIVTPHRYDENIQRLLCMP